MNWNIFKSKTPKAPKPDLALQRHEALLTAVAKLHNQVIDLENRIEGYQQAAAASQQAAETLPKLMGNLASLFTDVATGSEQSIQQTLDKLFAANALESQALAEGQAMLHEGIRSLSGEKHLLYDIQIKEPGDAIVAIRLHDDPNLKWGASDGRPPFRLEQRYLTADQVEELRKGLPQ